MLKATGKPFVGEPFEITGRWYTGDENALIALHKMRLVLGSAHEIEARPGSAAKGLAGSTTSSWDYRVSITAHGCPLEWSLLGWARGPNQSRFAIGFWLSVPRNEGVD
jgi:hypothetical protein